MFKLILRKISRNYFQYFPRTSLLKISLQLDNIEGTLRKFIIYASTVIVRIGINRIRYLIKYKIEFSNVNFETFWNRKKNYGSDNSEIINNCFNWPGKEGY